MKDADLYYSEHKRWYLERVSEKISHNSQNMLRAASELYERTLRSQVSPISQILDLLQSNMLHETLVAVSFNFTYEDISNLFESFLDDLLTKFQD
jgi:bacterioferritin (cytochrome b1)